MLRKGSDLSNLNPFYHFYVRIIMVVLSITCILERVYLQSMQVRGYYCITLGFHLCSGLFYCLGSRQEYLRSGNE